MVGERETLATIPHSELESFLTSEQFVDPDRDIIDRARRGDKDALAAIYGSYQHRVYRYMVARLGNAHAAEDETSEVFVKVINAIGNFEWKDVPFSSWIFKIAHNHCISEQRRRRFRECSALPLEEGMMSFAGRDEDVSSVEDRIDNQERLRKAIEACRQLPPALNQVISFRYFAGLSVADTARVLDKGETYVKVTQQKALRILRQILNVGGQV